MGNVVSSTPVDNDRFWLVSDKGYTLLRYANGHYHRMVYIPAAFFGLECGDYINKVRVMDSVAYFCLNGGVGRMDMRVPLTTEVSKGKLLIRKIEDVTSDRQRRLLSINGNNPKVKGDVDILLSYPNYNNAQLQFVYTLSGSGLNLRSVASKPEIIYSSLHYGKYRFKAEVIDVNGHRLGIVEYEFKVHPTNRVILSLCKLKSLVHPTNRVILSLCKLKSLNLK